MYILIDIDEKRDKGIIKSDFLPNIREHFSEEDTSSSIRRYRQNSKYIPDRKYAITPTGRFEVGMLKEIVKFLKSLSIPFKLEISEAFKRAYFCGYKEHTPTPEEAKLNLPLREYQVIGLQKGLEEGKGVFLYPTASGKTLLIASMIQTIRKTRPQTKVLLITLTHLVTQIYDDFLSYGVPADDMCKWTGDHELNMNSKIVIAGYNIIYGALDNMDTLIKKVKVGILGSKKFIADPATTHKERMEHIRDLAELEKALPKLLERKPQVEAIQNYFRSVNLLMVDEVHTLKKSNEITEIAKYITTRNRFGFTGTLPESLIDQWNIIGLFGPIVYNVDRKYLVENKYIADVDIRILKIDYDDRPDYTFEKGYYPIEEDSDPDDDDENETNYIKELNFIHNNDFRNGIIQKICDKVSNNILIIVERLEHGEILLSKLSKGIPNKEVFFIKGEVEDEEREKIKKLMEKQNNIICIAISKIFSTGINIKNLHHIVFASAGKAKVKLIQSIGRGVRMLDGKTKVTVFDLADELVYGERHLKKRITVYNNEGLKYQFTPIQEKG